MAATAETPHVSPISEAIRMHRENLGLTQDEYGRRYSVSGPAVFKFERGYVTPSLAVWRRIAADAGIRHNLAVLEWARAKLPEDDRGCIVAARNGSSKSAG